MFYIGYSSMQDPAGYGREGGKARGGGGAREEEEEEE